jgi:threonine-phosphate decarboxylase
MALSTATAHGGDVFAIAREHGWNWRDVLDFSANINPLGPSPLVKPAICQALDRVVHYPEPEPARLRKALAGTWKLEEDQILLGNGATELIFFLSRFFRSTPVTLATPVFSEFHRAFPDSRTADLMDSATWPAAGLLVLTRPANPTGWTLPLETLTVYLDRSDATVLTDESFIEFCGLPSAAALIERYPQLIVLRSLTKFYALPGLRVGALIASPARIASWKQQREPWQVNVLAEEAALAAIGDGGHASRSLEFVTNERTWFVKQLSSMPNATPLPTDANFVFIRLASPASQLTTHLLREKILLRNCSDWPGLNGQSVRAAVRLRHENERLLAAWREFGSAIA